MVVDVGTGCGAIAVSVAANVPGIEIWATDISRSALEVARRNADYHGVQDRIRFLQGDLLEPLRSGGLEGRVDVLLSNPPYVDPGSRISLSREVERFEPAIALYGGPNGLESIRRLLADSPDLLRSGGLMLLEIGLGQREEIERLLFGTPFAEWEFQRDYGGIERVLRARRE